MSTRIISGLVLLPVLIFFIVYGGIPLKIAVLVLSVIGMYEFYRAFYPKPKALDFVGYSFAVIYVVFSEFFINQNNMFNILVSAFLVVLLIAMVLFHNKVNIKDIMVTFFGFFYVCFLISHIYLIREYTYGKFFVWLVFICAFGCDTGAYFSGMLFGKRKLIPELSPKKTVEGAVGGVITATVVAVVYGICIERYFKLENVNTTILCLITGIAGSVLSQIGDLAASSVKRFVNLKDYGNLIPGHGGILDRFDSVLLTAPVVYYIMLFLIEVL
ncbi:MAG: phosphatidate cytidylyltransferase [Lachnospiraceae bacterium]|nr:phosphatidate cytidylyltransferase [Lachnospiraceae bacterium]